MATTASDPSPSSAPSSASRTPSPSASAPGDQSGAPAHLGIALAVISAAQLMVVLDGTIVNIALPHIQTDLGFTPGNLSWVVNAYTLAFGGLLLLGGRLGDILGRRRVFIAGVVIFAFASLLGGIAQTETILLASRALQGVGAALASPTALSLITTTFPAGPPRNRAMGVYAAMSGAGAAIGLILGGVLTEFSWRWTFFINVPIGILVVLLAPKFLQESARVRGTFDVPGAVTGSAGIALLVYGLTHAAPPNSWGDAATVIPIVLGLALLAAFVMIERSTANPLLPFRVLADRTRAVSFTAMLVVGAAMFAMFYFLGLYIQQVLGYSPTTSGFAFLPFSIGIVAAAQVASMLISRVDPRWISGVGTALASVGMLGFSRLTIDSSYATDLLPFILLMSFGMGLTFVPMTLTAVAGVDKADAGVGSAVLNTTQQVGGAVGLAVLSTIFANAAADKGARLGAELAQSAAGLTPAQLAEAERIVALQAQTYGSAQAYIVAAGLIAVAAVIILVGLNIKHSALASHGSDADDSVPVVMH